LFRLLPAICALTLTTMTIAQSHRSSSPKPPTVYLNHVFVVPDPETYEAIRTDDFLRREFAPLESRTTVRRDKTYTGIYLYGQSTYFELLKPPEAGDPENRSGLAFGVERSGALHELRAAFSSTAGVNTEILPITRQTDTSEVSWFQMLVTDAPFGASQLQTWVMEYDAGFLRNWYGQLPPAQPGITRAAVLERYTAKINESQMRTAGLMQDISEVHLALENQDADRFLKYCYALGYPVVPQGKRFNCSGPGFLLDVSRFDGSAPPSRPGVVAIEFRLRRKKDGEQSYRIGNSILQFKGTTAIWTF